jgi:pyruvate dehydrogenase E2 component (dihydrolipoamide acetyltransferase)
MYQVDSFEGIITPGQTFILAVGKLQNRPWVANATLVVKPTLVLNLSVDHRVADGAVAAVFLQHIAEVVENPYQILWNSDAQARRRE